MPAIGDREWLVLRSMDWTVCAEAVCEPPPGQNMMMAIVRCLPPLVPSAYDHALALCVQESKVVLRRRVPLLRRFSEPRDRLHVVLRYAVAGRVNHTEFLLGIDVALRGGLADPRDALRLVLWERAYQG